VQAPKTQYADSNGVSIAYQDMGAGDVALIIVPGAVSNVEVMWSEPIFYRLIRNFTRFARVIVFDKRGTGCSDPVVAPPTLDERIDDITAVMDAAGVERAFLEGISEGGPMAMLFAATYPERVQGLVLYGTFPKWDAPGPPEISVEPIDLFEQVAEHWGEGRSVELFAPQVAHDPIQRRMWAVWERTGASPGMVRKLVASIRGIDVRPILASISVPTLVLHCTGDMIPIAGARYLADNIAGARIVELQGGSHAPYEPEIVDQLCGAVEEFIMGSRHRPDPERALATVLFTDIVGSTEQAASVGDRTWRAQLEEHDELVRGALGRFRGREVKTLGDGFLATFDGPARAVQCARALVDDVGRVGLSIRAGIHTGEVEVLGEDIGGMAVHLAARVSALAGAGEVLVTSTVRDLVIGSDLHFTDRGRHALKGVPGEWQLLAAVGEAPAAVAEPIPTSMRAPTVTGRAMDVMAVKTPRLARAGARLSRKMATARR
jgi:class 3 adenylate cyclase